MKHIYPLDNFHLNHLRTGMSAGAAPNVRIFPEHLCSPLPHWPRSLPCSVILAKIEHRSERKSAMRCARATYKLEKTAAPFNNFLIAVVVVIIQ